jgi:hypothetical protein
VIHWSGSCSIASALDKAHWPRGAGGGNRWGVQVLITTLVLALFAVPLSIAIRRSTELFVLDVDAGRTTLRRGRLPQALFRDIVEVFQSTQAQGRLRVIVEQQVPTLDMRGRADEYTLQRLRNLVGAYPLAKIRAGNLRR